MEHQGASFLDKNPTRIILTRFGDFFKNLILGTELASFSDKNPDHIPDFSSRNDADSIPKKKSLKIMRIYGKKMSGIFCPDASSIPRIWIFWIFPEFTDRG